MIPFKLTMHYFWLITCECSLLLGVAFLFALANQYTYRGKKHIQTFGFAKAMPFSTGDSHFVPNSSTKPAQRCLTSQF